MDEIIDRLRKVRKGAMFVIEAPSGTGKGTVIKEILKMRKQVFYINSCGCHFQGSSFFIWIPNFHLVSFYLS